MALNTTPDTWVAGAVLTAAQLNTEIRDAITGIQSAWTSYVPTWTGTTTNPVIGNGTITGAYRRIGKTIEFRISVTAGSTTTFGTGVFQLTLPVAPLGTTDLFLIKYNDSSAATHYLGLNYTTSSSTINLGVHNSAVGGAIAGVTNAVPFAWANLDNIRVNGVYECA